MLTEPVSDDQPTAFDLFVLSHCDRFRDLPGSSIAPNFVQKTVIGALGSYLWLEPGEILLAIVRDSKNAKGDVGCALTNRAIHWAGPPTSARPPSADRAAPWRACRVAYTDLSPMLPSSGGPTASIASGEGMPFSLIGAKSTERAVLGFLKIIQPYADGESEVPNLNENELSYSRKVWPAAVAATKEVQRIQADLATMRPRSRAAARGVVTPLIALACVGIYVAMVVSGISPLMPDLLSMLKWGANFGPSATLDGQWWRLFTSMFLHFGLVHLGMNMWCLLMFGPLLEKLFGRPGFTVLYLLSGLGGAITSLVLHPLGISAGASGAIFGMIGGLLGHLVIRRNQISASLLKSMSKSALAFVGYNLLIGFFIPGIDISAHVGGLITGFVAGLALTLGSKPKTTKLRAISQTMAAVALSVTMVLATYVAIGITRQRVLTDPKVNELLKKQDSFGPAWNEFSSALEPISSELDMIGSAVDTLINDYQRKEISIEKLSQGMDGLIGREDPIEKRIATIPAANPEIQVMRDRVMSAQRHHKAALISLKRSITDQDEKHITGPDGFDASMALYKKDNKDLNSLIETYMKAHHLTLKP